MNILICNDDGIHSNGIITLVNTFKSKGHKVFLVAPASEKVLNHAITIKKPYVLSNMMKIAGQYLVLPLIVS